MITNSLIELLQDNECVIVPDFGAFISKRHSATIDYANHRFTPPYKEIVFNNKLKNDDGLLVDFMIEKESLTKEDALAKIRSFVNQSEAILDVNSELVLEGIGKIRKFGDDYILTSKTETNLLGDSFGLTEFNVQPVFRTETYQIIKERIAVEQKDKNTEYTVAVENVEDTPEVVKMRKPGIARPASYVAYASGLMVHTKIFTALGLVTYASHFQVIGIAMAFSLPSTSTITVVGSSAIASCALS